MAGVYFAAMTRTAYAVDGTWTGPGDRWTTGTNWSSTPVVPDNTATFTNNGAPTTVRLVDPTATSINTIQFTATAPAYTISVSNPADSLTIAGAGIVNASSFSQVFDISEGGRLVFQNGSTAGNASLRIGQNGSLSSSVTFSGNSNAGTARISASIFSFGNSVIFNNNSSATNAAIDTSVLTLNDNSTAGNANITITAPCRLCGGFLTLNGSSTAGSATISFGGSTTFNGSSTAANSVISFNGNIVTGDSSLVFNNTSSAGNAVINNLGASTGASSTLTFHNNSTPANATIMNGPGGQVDFSGTSGPGADRKLTAGSIAGAGTFFLGANQLTAGGNNSSTEVSGIIADSRFGPGTGGSLVKTGTGTLTLSGANSYTGLTTVNGGSLVLTPSGSIAGNLLNNAILASSGTVSGALTNNGTASINAGTINGGITNTGTLSFNNATVAQGAIVNNNNGNLNNTMSFNDASSAGGASITNNFVLNFNNSSTAAGATITDNFVMNFRNSSTAGSATFIMHGGVNFFDTTTAGAARIFSAGGVRDNYVVNFHDNSTAGNAVIDQSVGFTNSSVLISFRDTSTAGNASIVNRATVSFFDHATAGNATIANGNSLVHTLNFSDFSSAGNAVISNLAVMNFSNNSTGGNATIANGDGTLAGVLNFRGNSTPGNAVITNNLGSRVDFSGAVGLAGDNKISIGSIAGAGNYFLGKNQLTVGGNNLSTEVSGIITDGGSSGGTGGSLAKTGTGTLTLSGIDTYTGATTVNVGTLSVNGSISSSSLTTVNAGATLGGNGVVGNTVVSGGTLGPGNSIGLLTVQGSLAFTAASSYMVEVSPANADRTSVTGTATLSGAAVKANFAAGTYVARQYTIVNAAGGVSGAFNSLVNTNLPGGFTSSLSYDANNVYLNLALSFIPPPNMGLNANQQAVANAVVGFFSSGSIPIVFGALTPAGLTQISGEVATGTQQTTFDAMNQFMGVITDPFIAGRGGPVAASASAAQFADENEAANAYASSRRARSKSERDAYAAVYRKAPVMADTFMQRWSVWGAGYGGSQTTDGNTVLGSNNTRSSIGGVAVGADYRFSTNTLAGFAIAGGGTNFSVNGLGSGRSDLFQAGAFVRHTVGAAYLAGALAYGWQDITTDRSVTVAGTDLLRANFNANAFSGRAEGGYRLVAPWMGGVGITSYAAGQFITFDLPAYAEQAVAGANTFALSYSAKSIADTRSELGFRSDKSYAMQNEIFTLRGRVAWAHDFKPDRSIGATFQTLPGASFVVNGAARAGDAALVTGSAEMKWLNGFSLAGTFEGEFSGVTRSYAGKGVVRYAW